MNNINTSMSLFIKSFNKNETLGPSVNSIAIELKILPHYTSLPISQAFALCFPGLPIVEISFLEK